MKKILFVPNTAAQVQKFCCVARALPRSAEWMMVALDRFKSDSTIEEMRREKLPFRELPGITRASVDKFLREAGAGLVVLGNDDEVISRTFIDAARPMGIPSLLMQDGAICPQNFVLPITLDYIPTALSIYGPAYLLTKTLPKLLVGKGRKPDDIYRYGTYAQYVAAWGGYSKRSFVSLGAKPERVFVTGSPAMDAAAHERGARACILARLGADPGKKTLLFVPSDAIGARLYTRKEYRGMCDAAAEAVRGQKNMQMIIKPHPSFLRREPHYFDRYSCPNIFIAKGSPYEFLAAADALVAEMSTMILEAIAFGLPVIVLNLTGRGYPCEPYPRIYVEQGVAKLVESEEMLPGALHSVLFDKKTIFGMQRRRPQFVADQLYRLDGESAKRVADLVVKLNGG